MVFLEGGGSSRRGYYYPLPWLIRTCPEISVAPYQAGSKAFPSHLSDEKEGGCQIQASLVMWAKKCVTLLFSLSSIENMIYWFILDCLGSKVFYGCKSYELKVLNCKVLRDEIHIQCGRY